jgi:hypothetical protein
MPAVDQILFTTNTNVSEFVHLLCRWVTAHKHHSSQLGRENGARKGHRWLSLLRESFLKRQARRMNTHPCWPCPSRSAVHRGVPQPMFHQRSPHSTLDRCKLLQARQAPHLTPAARIQLGLATLVVAVLVTAIAHHRTAEVFAEHQRAWMLTLARQKPTDVDALSLQCRCELYSGFHLWGMIEQCDIGSLR